MTWKTGIFDPAREITDEILAIKRTTLLLRKVVLPKTHLCQGRRSVLFYGAG